MARLVFISLMLLFALVNAQFDCKSSCKSHKKNRICASNGISFKTPCLMQKYACARGITLTVVSEGRCPDGVAQPQQQREQESDSSEEEDAPAKFGGGSSSDEGSNSGSSEEHKAPFTTGLPGPMATTTLAPVPLDTNQPMTPEGSTDYVTEIEMDATTSACMMNCPLVLDIVCGTDGVTYQSRCVLEAEACRRGDTNVTVAHPGPCIQATLAPGSP